jgi:hypothetical protein
MSPLTASEEAAGGSHKENKRKKLPFQSGFLPSSLLGPPTHCF